VNDRLKELEKSLAGYMAASLASEVVDAASAAGSMVHHHSDPEGYDDRRMTLGCVEFLSILAESEMDRDALVAAVFHYGSTVARSLRGEAVGGEADFLRGLAGTGVESRGIEAAKTAVACCRLKHVESLSAATRHSTPHPSERRISHNTPLLPLLLSAAKDWRSLGVRCGASLYRLRMLEMLHISMGGGTGSGGRSASLVETAREALHVFSPMAERLGMHRMKRSLDDAAFRVLYPRQWCGAVSMLEGEERGEMRDALLDVNGKVKEMLKEDDVFMSHISSCEVKARVKEPYSLWKKMQRVGASDLKGVPDALALRVILEAAPRAGEGAAVRRARERALCYYAKERIIGLYPDLGGKYKDKGKDYIAEPKPNGYQSLHASTTTRLHGTAWPFEVQVRSREMDRVAEYGLAAHWNYKVGGDGAEGDDDYWRAVREHDRAVARRKGGEGGYLEALALDRNAVRRESVFVFVRADVGKAGDPTPHGRLFEMPVGATVGNVKEAAEWGEEERPRLNGKKADWASRVENGDVVNL